MKKHTTTNTKLLFAIIFITGLFFRAYGFAWDSGFHLHPDERAIILAVLPLHLPASLAEFLSPQSPLNPHFFAYGNFPMYLLLFSSSVLGHISSYLTSYDGVLYVGRVLSLGFDMGTLCLVYFLGKRLVASRVGLIASFFYAVSVLPIQLSHFYAVDTLLTFFITLLLYLLIRFYERPTVKKSLALGITFGLALATKISAIVLIAPLGITIIVDDLLIGIKTVRRWAHFKTHLLRTFPPLFISVLIILVGTIVTVIFTEPYVLLDKQEFLTQTAQQAAMTKNPFLFPYTLQYVGIIHYVYEIRNFILFGEGTLLSLLGFLGIIFTVFLVYKKDKKQKWAQEAILLTFLFVYVGVVGNFAVGYMRYLLPIYPIFSVFAALFAERVLRLLRPFRVLYYFVCVIFSVSLLLFPLTFLHIYTVPNTRVQATNWILTHIPAGKTLAIEHWDDSLPLVGQASYTMTTLPLYDPDTTQKWQAIDQQLAKSDYIIIASMRLAAPLTRLTNCRVLPPDRCYPMSAAYYHKLFDGTLGFTKVADFTVFPTVPLLNLPINDESSDESFTVYDHPHVMIFKKTDKIR